MIFPSKKAPAESEDLPYRAVRQLLQGSALHCVEFDVEQQTAFRSLIGTIADRCRWAGNTDDWLALITEANSAVQGYNLLVEKFIHELRVENRLATELLSQSLLRVCHASDKSAQSLRTIEKDLAEASQLQDMRVLRSKLAACLTTLCLEAEAQEAQYMELKERLLESHASSGRDQVTGLNTLKSAETRINEMASLSARGHVIVFFLKNLEVVNRRLGYSAGDTVLKRFVEYLESKSLRTGDQLFRWRGPCFVVVTGRFDSTDAIRSDAHQLTIRGPEIDLDCEGKSMLFRLTGATTAFAIPKGLDVSTMSAHIDQFAADQFKLGAARG